MKKILTALFFMCFAFAAAAQTVTVSIPPQKYIVEKIADDLIKVNVMVPKGSDPHSFSPKSGQIKQLSNSDMFLAIGFPFESSMLPDILKAYPKIKIVETQHGIEFEEHEHHPHGEHGDHDDDDGDDHDDDGDDHDDHHGESHFDPHIWTSPRAMLKVAENTYEALAAQYPQHKDIMKKNYDVLIENIKEIDHKFNTLLKKGEVFLVYHPAFGYFARDYGLVQLAIERDGKEPKAMELKEIIDNAKSEDVRLFIVTPQQSTAAALTVAQELKIGLVTVDILDEDWENMMNRLYRAFEAVK